MESEYNKFLGTNTPNAENNVSDVTNPLLTQNPMDSSQTNTPNAENNVPNVANPPMPQILMKKENNKFLGTNTPNAENNVPAVTNPSMIQKAIEMSQEESGCWEWIQHVLPFFKKNRKVTIQLYCAQKTVMTDYAMQELEEKLTSHPFHGVPRFSVLICKNISSIQRDIPLIVICLSSSRLSVDLRNAISGVQTGSNTVVLIFHHLKPHALPTESSHTILTKDEVCNVGIIIDVAFFESMGIYKCDMNIKAYMTLITFIEANCKQ